MVEYRDGSVIAQLGMPDMRTPIAHALAWPKRIEAGVKRLHLPDLSHLEFREPDFDPLTTDFSTPMKLSLGTYSIYR